MVSENTALLCAPKHYQWLDPQLTCRWEGEELVITAAAFAKHVCVESDDPDVLFSDNFFDMNAGEKRITVLRGKAENLRLRSVYDLK